MPEHRDPAIKLFGKTIQLLHLNQANEQSRNIKETMEHEHDTSQSTSYGINDDPKTPTTEKETSLKNNTKKESPNENSNSDEKPQKPDKILPCPRCNSMDTKFCYYNNYNVNQPRHFCKNCQRYWTAGGTMRNTPVGSGRRKNKSLSSASYYRHIIVNDTSLKSNGSVLNFGSDVPLSESMNHALNFIDKSQKPKDDHSSSASNSVEKGGNVTNIQKYPFQIPYFAPPWPYQWNSGPYRPVPFYPTPQYWGCSVQVPPTQWSMPWIAPPNDQTTLSSPLGKHSRNEEFSRDQDFGSGVLIPKTLRINNPNDASKNSLLSTSGILKDVKCNDSINGSNLHKAFQSKNDEKNELVGSSLVNLQANPAAFSRSRNFQESS